MAEGQQFMAAKATKAKREAQVSFHPLYCQQDPCLRVSVALTQDILQSENPGPADHFVSLLNFSS